MRVNRIMCIGIITAVVYILHYTDHRVNVQIHNIQGVANNTAHMTLIDAITTNQPFCSSIYGITDKCRFTNIGGGLV